MEQQEPLLWTLPINPNDEHGAEEGSSEDGGKLTFYEHSYWLKLVMLLVLRGFNNNFQFHLTTEMKNIGKFGDMIFEHIRVPNGEKNFRFFWAKCNNSETKDTISIQNLFQNSEGDFSLQKYLRSYLEIQKNPRFSRKEDKIKDLIIFTDQNFKYGDTFGDLELCDDIFYGKKTVRSEEKLDEIFHTCLLQFQEKFKGRNYLVSHLKDVFIKLPKVFAEKIFQGKELDLDDYNIPSKLLLIHQIYEKALFNEVIQEEKGRFQESFLDGHDLSPEADHFRASLQREYFSKYHRDELSFEDAIRNTTLKVYNRVEQLQGKISSSENIAETLAYLIHDNTGTKIIRVTDNRSVIVINIQYLSGSVFIRNKRKVKLNPEFLYGHSYPNDIITLRENFLCELKKWQIELRTIEDYVFEIESYPEEEEIKITINYMEDTVNSFIQKLKFAVNQLDEVTLGKIIKNELLKDFEENENIYESFLEKMFEWLKDRDGIYFSHNEVHTFFEQLKNEMQAMIWFDVKNPTHNFTGREKELSALHKEIQRKSAVVITQSESISGLGGVGKTELAKQYVYLHSGEYKNVIWINAESHATMANSFHRLAFDKLGVMDKNTDGKVTTLEIIVNEVYHILWGKKSLFIFDNAENISEDRDVNDADIQNFIPKSPSESKHHTLITSQSISWENLNQVKLQTFTEKESAELIGNSINLFKDMVEVKNLAKALDYYPLGLHLALAYIKASHEEKVTMGECFTIGDYMNLFQKARNDLINFPFQSSSHDPYTKGIYTILKITLDDIEQRKDGKLAIELLNLISYFVSYNISMESISYVLDFVDDNEPLLSAIRLLKQYSMVEIENKKLNLHKLIQLVTRLRLREGGEEVEILRRGLEAVPKLDTEHAVSIWEFSTNYSDLITTFGDRATYIMDSLFNYFKFKEAVSFGRSSIKTLVKHLGDKHSFVLEAKENLAHILDSIGNYEEALMEYEDLFRKYRSTLGEDDPKTLKMKHLIATMMYNIGNYYEALEYYKSVYNKICKLYGEDAPDALNLKLSIANVLCNLGEHTQALKSYSEVHEKWKLSMGENDTNTMNAKQNIAYVLVKLGDYYEALNYYEEVYNQTKTILNEDHEITITTKHNMASVLDKLNRYDEALGLYQDVYKMYENKYGREHPDSLNTKLNISNVLFKLEQNEEALKSYEDVFELLKNIYGESHQETVHAKFCIAQVLYNSKENEKALAYYQEVYDHICQQLGDKHPKGLRVKERIANTLYELGLHEQSLQSCQEIYKNMKMYLGDDHPDTISIKQFTAKILCKLGKYEEAFNVYNNLHQKMRIIYGEWNEKTFTAQQNMASTLLNLGKASESLSCFENVYDKQRAVLGENHPSTRLTKELMSSAWQIMTNQHKQNQMISIENQMLEQGMSKNEDEPDSLLYKEVDNENEIKVITHPNTDSSPSNSLLCKGCLKRFAYTCTLQ